MGITVAWRHAPGVGFDRDFDTVQTRAKIRNIKVFLKQVVGADVAQKRCQSAALVGILSMEYWHLSYKVLSNRILMKRK
jgi:hypothetical protein